MSAYSPIRYAAATFQRMYCCTLQQSIQVRVFTVYVLTLLIIDVLSHNSVLATCRSTATLSNSQSFCCCSLRFVNVLQLTVCYTGKANHAHDVGCVRADRPLPTNVDSYYFEVTFSTVHSASASTDADNSTNTASDTAATGEAANGASSSRYVPSCRAIFA
jgi:hypothetical protein